MEPPTLSNSSSSSTPVIPRRAPRRSRPTSRWPDRVFFGIVTAVGVSVIGLAAAIVGILAYGSRYSIQVFGFSFLWGTV